MATLQHIELYNIDAAGTTCYGGDQEWYGELWHRRAGCGPTNCANLLWYLSRTRKELAPLCPFDGSTRTGFTELMDALWDYVTPGRMGVNTTAIFTGGTLRYAQDTKTALVCRVLEVPRETHCRPGKEAVWNFLTEMIGADIPVAFLNLSNGALTNLDSWHWVTLVQADKETGCCDMLDGGRRCGIDLSLWLDTTIMGGGFVAILPQ